MNRIIAYVCLFTLFVVIALDCQGDHKTTQKVKKQEVKK